MQPNENIQVLIDRYLAGTATAEEKLRFNEWYHSFNDNEAYLAATGNETEQQLADRIKNRLLISIREKKKPVLRSFSRRNWQIAAAVIFVLASFGIYFIISSEPKTRELVKVEPPGTQPKKDLAPGGNKATLTMADGSSIVLDSTSVGTISQQGDIKVQKLKDGLVAYTVNGKQLNENSEAFFNTITTPAGGQYQVTLADGTKVWLNALSSIRFPIAFTGTERTVEITGEVYFEVAKNKSMPFKVRANASEIVVLGTHFNINAYKDEPFMKTTLLEGRIRVSGSTNNQSSRILQPGQQAGINKEGLIDISDVDTEEAVAWMNGYFPVKSMDLKTLLRQIARWYDVDILYKGDVNIHFTGQLNRDENLSKLFEKLALTGEIHFKIEGRKIIVSE